MPSQKLLINLAICDIIPPISAPRSVFDWKRKDFRGATRPKGEIRTMREYELVLIVSPELDEIETDAIIQGVKGNIESNAGEVIKIDSWGRKRLAFPIKRHSDAFYVLFIFKSEPASVRKLTNSFRVIEPVLRHMVVEFEGDLDKILALRDEAESRTRENSPPPEEPAEKENPPSPAEDAKEGAPGRESENDADTVSGDGGEDGNRDEVGAEVSAASDES